MAKTPAKIIDYTSYDFDELTEAVKDYIKSKDTFADIDFDSSNITTLAEMVAYIGSILGFYINATANESFLPATRLYKNANKIAKMLGYAPAGYDVALVDVILELAPEYVFGSEGLYFEIPSYSKFPTTKATSDGKTIMFTNVDDFIYTVKGYGIHPIEDSEITYANGAITIYCSDKNPFTALDSNYQPETTVTNNLTVDASSLVDGTTYGLFFSSSPAAITIDSPTGDANEIAQFTYSSSTDSITITQNNAYQKFYLGRVGQIGLSNVTLARTDSETNQITLTVDDGKTYRVLIDGLIYSFSDGATISSSVFSDGHFADVTGDLNIILSVSSPPSSVVDAQLLVTESSPTANQVTIATLDSSVIDSSGNITWSLFNANLSWQHLSESVKISDLQQGIPTYSLIAKADMNPNSATNYMNLSYDSTTNTYTVGTEKISTNSIRVFVETDDGIEEWERASDEYTANITSTSKVFFVRVNQDQRIEIRFGQNDYGLDPSGSKILILGIQCDGEEGNIPANSIGDTIIPSTLGSDLQALQFSAFISTGDTTNNITDNSGADVEYTLNQKSAASGGRDPETVDEIRVNAPAMYATQKRIVSKSDHEAYIKQKFSSFVADVKVVNYTDLTKLGLITSQNYVQEFFNSVWIYVVPMIGTSISNYQKSLIRDALSDEYTKLLTTSYIIESATPVYLDVLVRYVIDTNNVKLKSTIEAAIRNALQIYFRRDNISIGQAIRYPEVLDECEVSGTSSVELMLIKGDALDIYTASEYDIDIKVGDYTGSEDLAALQERKIAELEHKGLIKKHQPLFDYEVIKDPLTGTTKRVWSMPLDIILEFNEFPILRDVYFEEEEI